MLFYLNIRLVHYHVDFINSLLNRVNKANTLYIDREDLHNSLVVFDIITELGDWGWHRPKIQFV